MSGGNWKEMLYACESGDLELVKYHIRMGIDPNYQHPEFLTAPLLESIRFGHLSVAKYLLENGADPNIKEAFGKETPFIHCYVKEKCCCHPVVTVIWCKFR